jgi:hypothetical protein
MDIKKILSKAGQISLLPQYQNSETMYERFSDATLDGNEEIIRSQNSRGYKLTDIYEIENDKLKYFVEKKGELEDEFLDTLKTRITESQAELFCSLISEYWHDGKTKRSSHEVKKLFASIKNYLLEYRIASSEENIKVLNEIDPSIEINFDDDEIEAIIDLNQEMIDYHTQKWIETRSDYLQISTETLHCRRGLYLKENFKENSEYFEWDFINSYSLGFTVTEKFAQMSNGDIPVIINKNLSDVRKRIIFFSPFIKGMPIHQFELGIIPHVNTMVCKAQGLFGGIHEFIIE